MQVPLHRERAQEQARADLGVGEPLPGELGDLALLGGELSRVSSVRRRARSPVATRSPRARAANAAMSIAANSSRRGVARRARPPAVLAPSHSP
jgi:hypothetical protein